MNRKTLFDGLRQAGEAILTQVFSATPTQAPSRPASRYQPLDAWIAYQLEHPRGMLRAQAPDPAEVRPAHKLAPASENDVTKALASVLSALSGGADKQATQMLERLVKDGQFKEALQALDNLDARMFHLHLRYPISKLTNAILSHRVKPHSDAAFLFEEHQFLRSHLSEIFRQHEGSACCADKAGWALRALARRLVDGKPIVVDLEQEFNFHLPTRVLNTEEDLVAMFRALRRLHAGMPDQYLVQMGRLSQAGALTYLSNSD